MDLDPGCDFHIYPMGVPCAVSSSREVLWAQEASGPCCCISGILGGGNLAQRDQMMREHVAVCTPRFCPCVLNTAKVKSELGWKF